MLRAFGFQTLNRNGVPTHRQRLLDYACYRGPLPLSKSGFHLYPPLEKGDGHMLLVVDVPLPQPVQQMARVHEGWAWERTDWSKVRELLSARAVEFQARQHPMTTAGDMEETMINELWAVLCQVVPTRRASHIRAGSPRWFTRSLLQLSTMVKKTWTDFKAGGSWARYRRARNRRNAALRDARRNYVERLMERWRDAGRPWTAVNSLRGRHETTGSIRRADGSIAVTDIDKAEEFATSWKDNFTGSTPDESGNWVRKFGDVEDHLLTVPQTLVLLRKTPRRKPAGEDGG